MKDYLYSDITLNTVICPAIFYIELCHFHKHCDVHDFFTKILTSDKKLEHFSQHIKAMFYLQGKISPS